MTIKNGDIHEARYDLNSHQWIIIKKEVIQDTFRKLKFPLIFLDLEFFNRSHQIKQFNDCCCDLADGQSYVYLLQFAIYRNFKQLIKSDPQNTIKELKLERKRPDSQYSFNDSYQLLVNDFISLFIKNKIKTIVLAGASNDEQIINSWFQKYQEQKNKIIKPEFWDIYPTLEQTMSFANLTAEGEIFWAPNNLKKGFSGDNSLSLPSLKKFFNYMTTVFPNFAYNDDADIYHLSREILAFFCQRSLSTLQYNRGMKAFREAQKHCFNDVYKLITIIKYWATLAFEGIN